VPVGREVERVDPLEEGFADAGEPVSVDNEEAIAAVVVFGPTPKRRARASFDAERRVSRYRMMCAGLLSVRRLSTLTFRPEGT